MALQTVGLGAFVAVSNVTPSIIQLSVRTLYSKYCHLRRITLQKWVSVAVSVKFTVHCQECWGSLSAPDLNLLLPCGKSDIQATTPKRGCLGQKELMWIPSVSDTTYKFSGKAASDDIMCLFVIHVCFNLIYLRYSYCKYYIC